MRRCFVLGCALFLSACGGDSTHAIAGSTTAGATTAGGTTGNTTTTGTTGSATTTTGTTGTTGATTTTGSTTTGTTGASGAGTTGTATTGTGTTGTGTTGTSTTGTSTTGSGGTTGSMSSSDREAWAWIYTNWTQSATQITSHASSITHVSPTFYTLNYTKTYASGVAQYWNCDTSNPCTYEGKTPKQYTAEFTAVGIKVVPLIYAGGANDGNDTSVQAILNNANGEADSFISSMVSEAVTQGYAGYNLDWELNATGSAYTDKFITFVNNFKTAMKPHGLTLSVDAIDSNIVGTYCSSGSDGNGGYLDFTKLGASSVDSIIIEDYTSLLGNASTSCQSAVLNPNKEISCPVNQAGTESLFTGLLDFMCSNLPASKVIIGMQTDSTNTNPIAGSAITAIEDYGMTRVAIWPQVENQTEFMSSKGLVASQSDWWLVLSTFLAHK